MKFFALFLAVLVSLAPAVPAWAQVDPTPLNRILKNYRRDNGDLDYAAIKAKESDRLAFFVNSLSRVDPERWAALGKGNQKAFWMNAHLGLLLSQILEAYPIHGDRIRFFPANSVQQLEGFWEMDHPVLDGRESLKSIEKKLATDLKDVRAVLALFTGARGGLPPPDEAWSGRNIDADIERRLKQFFESDKGMRHEYSPPVLWLAAPVLTFWRAEIAAQAEASSGSSDHGIPASIRMNIRTDEAWKEYPGEMGQVLSVIAPLLPVTTARLVRQRKHEIREIPFDWTLNDGTPPPEAPAGIPLKPEDPYAKIKDVGDLENPEIVVQPEHRPKKPKKELKEGEIKPLWGE